MRSRTCRGVASCARNCRGSTPGRGSGGGGRAHSSSGSYPAALRSSGELLLAQRSPRVPEPVGCAPDVDVLRFDRRSPPVGDRVAEDDHVGLVLDQIATEAVETARPDVIDVELQAGAEHLVPGRVPALVQDERLRRLDRGDRGVVGQLREDRLHRCALGLEARPRGWSPSGGWPGRSPPGDRATAATRAARTGSRLVATWNTPPMPDRREGQHREQVRPGVVLLEVPGQADGGAHRERRQDRQPRVRQPGRLPKDAE